MALPTLIIGDLHMPYHNQRVLESVIQLAESRKWGAIVQVGDLYDQYSYSRYHPDPGVTNPENELDNARHAAVKMWHRLRANSLKARCVQLSGNHDARASKRIAECLPALKALTTKTLRGLYTFDGVETVFDDTQEIEVTTPAGPVLFMHGFRSKPGDHARYNLQSTVVGHSHVGGLVTWQQRNRVLWELNVGWLGDITAPVFGYRSQKLACNWTLGVGIIDELGPRFCPM